MDDPRVPHALTFDQLTELRIARGDRMERSPHSRPQTIRQDRLLLVTLKLMARSEDSWLITERGRSYLGRIEQIDNDAQPGAIPPDVASRRQDPVRRKSDILAAAARAFADSGFRGASLRDIALHAGVSLPLLSHHFGSKAALLQAVVDDHHEVCRARMIALRTLVMGSGDAVPLDELVAEWVRYEYELYMSPAGEHYLQLMLKLTAEPEVDIAIQHRLDCTESIVLRGLERALPRSTSTARLHAFSAASSSLHAGIKDCAIAREDGEPDAQDDAIAFTTRFLVAGLTASLA